VALAKLDIYQQLKDDMLTRFEAVDLVWGSVRIEPTSELEAATGKTSQVNITIAPTVYADTRAGGSQAGEEVVRQISRFVQKNGSLTKVIDDRGRVAL
jgi:hypothetical protein